MLAPWAWFMHINLFPVHTPGPCMPLLCNPLPAMIPLYGLGRLFNALLCNLCDSALGHSM
jgi:hypothetical protein